MQSVDVLAELVALVESLDYDEALALLLLPKGDLSSETAAAIDAALRSRVASLVSQAK